MSFGPFPTPESSGYYSITVLSPSDPETGARLIVSGFSSIDPVENPGLIEELLDQLHGAVSPLGWEIQAREITDTQRSFEFTEPVLEE